MRLKPHLMTAEGLRVTRVRDRRRPPQGEDGFTLVESMVAITVAAVLFMALAGVLITSLRATILSRGAQQAIDLTTQAVESVRALDISQVGLDSVEAQTDSNIVANSYGVKLSDGTVSNEALVYVTNSPLKPHKTTVALDNATYTVAKYVTTPPADAVTGASYVRLTVVVSWTIRGQAHQKTSSTFITEIRRGLPQPKYTWAFTGSTLANQTTGIGVNVGSILTISAKLANKGARDRWNITSVATDTSSVVRAWQFAWWSDNGPGAEACNGVRDADETTRMDPNSDGVADTNTINTDDYVCLVGTYTVPVTESIVPTNVNVAVTATSNAVSSVSSTNTALVKLSAQNCTGCQYKPFYLQNTPAGVTTASTANLPASAAAPSQTVLLAYGTDQDANPGRLLQRGGTLPTTGTTPQSVANWRYQIGTTSCAFTATNALVNLYAVPNSMLASDGGSITVQLRYETAVAGTFADWGGPVTFTASTWGYSTFAPVVIPVPVTALTIAKDKRVEVQIAVPSAAPTDIRLAYDTTAYKAVLELPVTSGKSC